MKRYEVSLRPAVNNGPQQRRVIRAETLRVAQDRAYREWGPHTVFGVRELRDEA
jgi:hypothetical protein